MKIRNVKDAKAFIATVNECDGAVWLESVDGDKINLKSELSQFVAIAELVSSRSDRLELFCSLPEDTEKFFALFNNSDIEL